MFLRHLDARVVMAGIDFEGLEAIKKENHPNVVVSRLNAWHGRLRVAASNTSLWSRWWAVADDRYDRISTQADRALSPLSTRMPDSRAVCRSRLPLQDELLETVVTLV